MSSSKGNKTGGDFTELGDRSASAQNQSKRIEEIHDAFKLVLETKRKTKAAQESGDIDHYAASSLLRSSIEDFALNLAPTLASEAYTDYWEGDEDEPIGIVEPRYPDIDAGENVTELRGVNREYLDYDIDDLNEEYAADIIMQNPEKIPIVGIKDFLNAPENWTRGAVITPRPPAGRSQWPEDVKQDIQEERTAQTQMTRGLLLNVFRELTDFMRLVNLDLDLQDKQKGELDSGMVEMDLPRGIKIDEFEVSMNGE